jgi:hypothetical protein
MKLLLTTFLFIINLKFVWAQSDFERGYQAGRASCLQKEVIWNCQVWFNALGINDKLFEAKGETRAESLSKLIEKCESDYFSRSCLRNIHDRKTKCYKL